MTSREFSIKFPIGSIARLKSGGAHHSISLPNGQTYIRIMEHSPPGPWGQEIFKVRAKLIGQRASIIVSFGSLALISPLEQLAIEAELDI